MNDGEGTPQEQKYPSKRKALPGESYAAEISFPSLSGLIEYNKAPAAIETLIIHHHQLALDAACLRYC